MPAAEKPADQRRGLAALVAFWRGPLHYVVILALLVGLVVPTALVLVYDANRTRRLAMEDLHRDLARTAEVMALSLAEPVWQVSPDLAEPMIKAQFDDPRFVSMQVMEPSSAQPFLRHSRPQAADEQDLTLAETRPVLRDGREIAQLTVRMSAAPLLRTKKAEMLAALWRSAGVLALSSVLILWVMRIFVLQPMTRLTGAAESLASGKLDEPLELPGADEIARVGVAMDRMRQALVTAFEALRNHAATLEQTVEQRTAQLTSSNAELSQALGDLQRAQAELVESEKLASLGRLVAGVAHELNTPLGNALTVVSSLEDRFAALDAMMNSKEPMRRSVLLELVQATRHGQDILHRNVQKAADLVRDFKQVSTDQSTDQRRDFDIAQVVEEVLVMVEPRFKPTPYAIETQLQPGLVMNSFPGSLGQVLVNLLMNTLVHAFEGADRGLVTIRCVAQDRDDVELSVSDDGKGMDESVRRRIFDPFFTTKLGTGGSGLGMHIVHNIIINVLGGHIEVHSSPGEGARMVMRLPRVAPQRVPAAA
ncbi:HAMP domain-containing histidine kinase [Pelomonas sp. KK5]|uniref:HAMP domain-containing histidine kinase n=1 Tax=Pelomonas sp. KK5 TaxID=1855730 RepID=UPI00097C15BC|nr:HAMP domain-containing histidine kinase [Pelomonas sp. KK5]